MADLSCEVLVLGMGTCGEDASLRLARSGLDVVGVEERLIGGECPYWACLPTKWLVRTAGLLAEARRADGRVGRVSVTPDWAPVAAGLRAEVTGGWEDAGGVDRFTTAGGRFLRGRGELTGPRTVRVGETVVRASRGVLLATGSRPRVPPVPGLATVPYWTTHDAVAAETLPAALVVLGGGAVACELAQVLARFGVDVTVVEGRDRILPDEVAEASAVVAEALTADGVTLRTGLDVVRVDGDESGVVVTLSDGTSLTADRLLVAAGRMPDADAAGASRAGASTRDGRVEVDGRLRAADGLWAIGDVTGVGLLTEVALHQGRVAVEDVLGAEPPPISYGGVSRVVFTDPEVGAVGLDEEAARAAGHDVVTVTKDLRATFRGWLHRIGNAGLVQLVVDREEDVLVGATVVGPRAGDVVGMLALAVRTRTPVAELVSAPWAFPTFSGAIGEALGAYGRGIVRVLDPGTEPVTGDPPPRIP